MIKVSVIVPIFGVEGFIEHCAESLMLQTLQDVEYLFINDATEDDSVQKLEAILSRFHNRREQVKIIHHTDNRGLPSARNTGLSLAQGEYIFHCDGDDFVEHAMLEELYNTAKKYDADLVWCDYYESFSNRDIYKNEPAYITPEECTKAMLSRNMQYNVWNKLVKRSLYLGNDIKFPDGYSMGEDLTMVKLFALSNRIAYIPKAYYHYVRYNTGAMTQVFDNKKIEELKHNMKDLESFLQIQCPEQYTKEMSYMKLWAKYRFLLTDGRDHAYENWQNWFPESHTHICSLPNANARIKALYWFASKKQWWLVWLHYWIVLRGYYSLKNRNTDFI